MVYELKNSRSIIYRVFDMFNIEGSEWESRAPEWITNAMLEMFPVNALKEITKTFNVVNYRFMLPCNMRLLGKISYKGRRLNRKRDYVSANAMDKYPIDAYVITNEQWVYVDGLEEGEVDVTYKSMPYVFDNEIHRQVPLIPDLEQVELALIWYCVRQLLYRGYKHHTLTFASNSPDINPALAWTYWKKEAKKEINRLDPDGRRMIEIMNRSFINFEDLNHKNR
jgi:hypothetical protein